MKIKKEHDIWYINFGEETLLQVRNEWNQLLNKHNWYSITFVEISFEKDDVCPGIEFVFMLFGLGFRFRHNFDMESTEQGKELKRRLDKVTANHKKNK